MQSSQTCSSTDCTSNSPKLIPLSDFVVHFTPEVCEFFSSKLGSDEFEEICKLACQAPP